VADVESITSFQAGCGKKPSDDESGIMNSRASVTTAPDYGNGKDQIHASTHDGGRRLSGNGVAGLKTSGLNDRDDETAD
jgi:hypothetical protein